MTALNTTYFVRCIGALTQAYKALQDTPREAILYEIYRSACVKEFELILEQAGKLLKKTLIPFFAIPKQVNQLTFKELFRAAALHGLISVEQAEWWFIYRDNRNDTANDYGAGFAEETLALLPQFTQDATDLNTVFQTQADG